MPATEQAYSRDSSPAGRLAGWARQGIESFVAAQKILSKRFGRIQHRFLLAHQGKGLRNRNGLAIKPLCQPNDIPRSGGLQGRANYGRGSGIRAQDQFSSVSAACERKVEHA